MKIECTINNYFKTYNEARGVAQSKKKILKTKSSKCSNYLTSYIISIIFIILLITLISLTKSLCLFNLGCVLLSLEVIKDIFAITFDLVMYSRRKKMNLKSIITLDEEGLTDASFQGIKMIFNWNKIKGVVIKKYSITILTDTSCYFYFDISNKNNIIKALEKYASKDIIIS